MRPSSSDLLLLLIYPLVPLTWHLQNRYKKNLGSVFKLGFLVTGFIGYAPIAFRNESVPIEFSVWLLICVLSLIIVQAVQTYDAVASPDISESTREEARTAKLLVIGYAVTGAILMFVAVTSPWVIKKLVEESLLLLLA